jgi:hypothetical protein
MELAAGAPLRADARVALGEAPTRNTLRARSARFWLVVLLLCGCRPVGAQGYPASQRGSVSQNVAHTQITVTYGRPVARGRNLFGGVVPFDRIWHPGADSATRISVSRDVLVEGQPLAAGDYSLWLMPRASSPWTVMFHRKARAFHLPFPGDDGVALRVDVTPDSASHMETMAVYFPVVVREEATMRIHWGTLTLPIRIRAPYRPE